MEAYRTHGEHSLVTDDIDLSKILEILSAIANSSKVKTIHSALGASSNLHLVGGIVRQSCLLSSNTPTDLDLASALTPEEASNLLQKAGIHTVLTGAKHGTVTAVVEGANCEITTFRKAGNQLGSYSKSILEDLSARDFTINAIAFDISNKKLADPHAGVNDLANGILRCVGSAEDRFREDPLRILRMVRFGPANGRTVADTTLVAAKALASTLEKVSVERIQVELVKILISDHAANAFRLMNEIGLLQYTVPELIPSVGFEQNEFHRFDVFEHTLAVIENAPKEPLQRLTALFHDIGKPGTISVDTDGRRHFYKHEHLSTSICKSVMERLHFSHDMTDSVSTLVRYHMRPFECGAPGVRRLLRDLGPLFEPWLTFKKADAMGAKFEAQELEGRISEFLKMVETERNRKIGSVYSNLAVDGNDLINIGVQPGPLLGRLLKALSEMVIDDPELNSKEVLLAKAGGLIASGIPERSEDK